jgi:hypothetical protein
MKRFTRSLSSSSANIAQLISWQRSHPTAYRRYSAAAPGLARGHCPAQRQQQSGWAEHRIEATRGDLGGQSLFPVSALLGHQCFFLAIPLRFMLAFGSRVVKHYASKLRTAQFH